MNISSCLVFPEAGYLCIPAVLPILKEVADGFVPQDNNQAQEKEEDPTTVILGVVANIFQKIIELLARRLRKEPEEGKQVDILKPSVLIYVFHSYMQFVVLHKLNLCDDLMKFFQHCKRFIDCKNRTGF